MEVQKDNLATLIEIWPSIKDHQELNVLWGDEIEYALLQLDHQNKQVDVAAKSKQVIDKFEDDGNQEGIDIEPEAYEYMVETAPEHPYKNSLEQLLVVEDDMRHRRQAIQKKLDASTAVFSLSRFGMFGVEEYNQDDRTSDTDAVRQRADSLLGEGARYKPVLDAMEQRRGFAMEERASLYINNKATSSSSSSSESLDNNSNSTDESVAVNDPIYAIGGCAVQANFGAKNLSQALYLHDQFCPIGPLMLALTAASPILKGILVDTDGRWNHCVKAADDRPPSESNLQPRWSTSPIYLENLRDVQALNHPLESNHEDTADFYHQLRQADMIEPLAKLYTHVLCRDPIMSPRDEAENDLEDRVERLNKHLTTSWPHIRLKLPSIDGKLPWIVEFRSMETQPTDFEITAMIVFLKLLERTVLHYRLELRIPMKLVEANMDRAQVADAVEKQRFWFNTSNTIQFDTDDMESISFPELSLDEIFNGQRQDRDDLKQKPYPGLLYFVRQYLSMQAKEEKLSNKDLKKIEAYVDLISQRASGEEPTPAKWMRDFVLQHPDHKGNNHVTHKIYYEMMCRIAEKSQIWTKS